jgi:NAD(P)-dependent dehydrogenase (short-subunit alcohol dehydrogenase family)
MSDMKSMRAIVVGASRGFGRGIVEALGRAGAEVHAVSRSDASDLVRADPVVAIAKGKGRPDPDERRPNGAKVIANNARGERS